MRILTGIILSSILLTSCSEERTSDPTYSYKYWTGTNPTDDIEISKGAYWQSGHWTREYILYLKLKPTNKWWVEFVKQNNLLIDNGDFVKYSDSPGWFEPNDKMKIYKRADDLSDSRYFRDNVTGECYIFEIQL